MTRGSLGIGAGKSRAQRNEDFRFQGQKLKVTKVAAGMAPTSTLSTTTTIGDAQSEPWTPICVTSRLGSDIVCGDSYLGDFLAASQAGVMKLQVAAHESGMLGSQIIIDSSLIVVQMNCDENLGMMYIRTAGKLEEADEPNKNGKLYSVPMDVVLKSAVPLTKKSLKQYVPASHPPASLFIVRASSPSIV